ncbi:MAG: EF-hand domain-containing protein, partial [Pleurocapsa sp.]
MTVELLVSLKRIVCSSNSSYTPVKKLLKLIDNKSVELIQNRSQRQQIDSPTEVLQLFEAIMFVSLADLSEVVRLTRDFSDRYAEAKSLVWIAPACAQKSKLGRELAEAEAIITASPVKSLIVRHAPLIDELLRNNKEIKFRRTLSLPLGDSQIPWLSSQDLADGIYNWLGDEASTSQKINITGSSQLAGTDLARLISQALEDNLNSRKFARRRFDAIDLDRSGQLDAAEMLAYLLELGYGSDEAQTIIEEADTDKDGSIDFEEFISGLSEHLEKILGDVSSQVQYIDVPPATALYDLISRGEAETKAQAWIDWLTAIKEFGLPVSDNSPWLDRESTSITDWLEQHILDFINVYILPGRGILTISEGILAGQPALTTKLLQSNDSMLQGVRTLDNKAVEWQIVGENSEELEIVRHELPKGGVRILKLKDSQFVGLSVRGLWTGRRWATELFFKHQPLPRWQINLFRELGELQIEEASSLIEPEGVVCNCTQTTCGKLQEMIEGGIDTLEQIADDTKVTLICGGCQPLVEELLGSANLAVAELVSKEDLGRGIFRFQLRPVGEAVATSKPGQHILIQGRVDGVWVT